MEIPDQFINSLIVLPSPPAQLQSMNPSIQYILGHNKTISCLIQNNLNGLVIRKQPEQCFNQAANYYATQESRHACLYIPAPNFDRLIVVKNVCDLSKSDAASEISDSVVNQLVFMSNLIYEVNDGCSNSLKVPITVFICWVKRCSKDVKKLQLELSNKISSIANSNIVVELKYVDVKMFGKKLTSHLIHKNARNSQVIQQLMRFYVGQSESEKEFYHLCPENIKILNSEFKLEEIDKVIELLNFYFPDKNKKLASIPHFNQIQDNMLYCHTDEGNLGNFCEYASYMGEVRLFSEKFLANLHNPTGVLIKGFSNKHLETILNPHHLLPQNFEIDWLHLGCGSITIIEVGMSENAEQPRSAIQNKITQCLTKIIPQFQFILFSLFLAYRRRNSSDTVPFCDIVQNVLNVIIYLPEVKLSTFALEMNNLKSMVTENSHQRAKKVKKNQISDDFITLVKKHEKYLTDGLLFLVCDEARKDLKLVRINDNFEVVCSYSSIQSFFDRRVSCHHSLLIDFVSSLISIASLSIINKENINGTNKLALDVNQRYYSSFLKWVFKRKQSEIAQIAVGQNFKLILSPQQHRILSEEKNTHLVVTGQPGSGKTTLLLAKCEEMALNTDVDSIYFVYHKDRQLFRNYLDNLVDENCSQLLKSKLVVHGIGTGVDWWKNFHKITIK